MHQQMTLFSEHPEMPIDTDFRSNMEYYSYRFRETDIGDITFQTGQRESIHRWYRLTPSFSPEVVRFFPDYNGFRGGCNFGSCIRSCILQGFRLTLPETGASREGGYVRTSARIPPDRTVSPFCDSVISGGCALP